MGGVKLPLKRIQNIMMNPSRRKEPLWKGPVEDGITQSLLSRFLVCQERFRIFTMEGLRPAGQFNRTSFYGSMWHICEEMHSARKPWEKDLKAFVKQMGQNYPGRGEELDKWYSICKVQFPIYVNHWSGHRDVVNRHPLFQEEVFKTPYQLPSGRTVNLRGMLDSVDIISNGLWLQENKTRGDINELKLKNELPNNHQTMFYLTALTSYVDHCGVKKLPPVKGVRYNVIRRPCSGGKHSITQLKGKMMNTKGSNGKSIKGFDGKPLKTRQGAETAKQFYSRLGELIEEEANFFFMRWQCTILKSDLAKYQREVLHPILENLCDWYEWNKWCYSRPEVDRFDGELHRQAFPEHIPRPFRLPYGIWNPILQERDDEFNEYISTGSVGGLENVETLFRELQA